LLRKEAGYSVEQRIIAAIASKSAFITGALEESRSHIAAELLATELLLNDETTADLVKEIEIGEDMVTIAVKKSM